MIAQAAWLLRGCKRQRAGGRPVRAQLADRTWRRDLYVRGGELASVQVTSPDGTLTETPVLASATRDAQGRRRTAVLGNGVAQTWQYDRETGRMARADAVLGTRTLQALRCTYDPDGHLVRLLDLAQEGAGALVPGAVTARRDFGYDGHGRLIQASGRVHQALLQHDYIPGTGGTLQGTRHLSLDNGAALERYTQTFEYDPSGNLLALRHAGQTRSWATELWVDSASNRAAPALDPNGNPVSDPPAQFDAGGNTIQLAHLRSMQWSWRGCLERAVTVERANGEVDDDESYGYGPSGHRSRKRATRLVVGGSSPVVETRDVVYLGDQERVQVRRNGTLVLERWTTHISDGERRIAVVDRHTVDTLAVEVDTVNVARIRYHLTTPQGSTALELDGDGRLISYEEYFPHGGTAFLAGDDAREVARRDARYCGKTRDDATGLYAYPYRYYAPWLGRWLSPDPIGPADDLNLYQFVLGDPIGRIDPHGTDSWTWSPSVPGGSTIQLEFPDPAAAAATHPGARSSASASEAPAPSRTASDPYLGDFTLEGNQDYEARYGALHDHTIEGSAFVDTITSGYGSQWGAKGHAQFRTVDDASGRHYQVYARTGHDATINWGWQDVDYERFEHFRNVNHAYEHGTNAWTSLSIDADVSNPTEYFTSVLAGDAGKVEQFAGNFSGAKHALDFQAGQISGLVETIGDIVKAPYNAGKNSNVGTAAVARRDDRGDHGGWLGLFAEFDPLYHVLVNTYEAKKAADRGDYYEAGRRTSHVGVSLAETFFFVEGFARSLARIGARVPGPEAIAAAKTPAPAPVHPVPSAVAGETAPTVTAVGEVAKPTTVSNTATAGATPAGGRTGVVSLEQAPVARLKKLYENIFPDDPWTELPRIKLQRSGDKWITRGPNGTVRSATGRYAFVTIGGEILVTPITRGGHVNLASGRAVEYAGEVAFGGRGSRGILRSWNNLSGHYVPEADRAWQAGLPLDKFLAFYFREQ